MDLKTAFQRSFARDLRKIRYESVKAIEQIEAAETLRELPNVTKLSEASAFYRLRVGDYRIGIAVEGEQVEFVRCLHRRDIYQQPLGPDPAVFRIILRLPTSAPGPNALFTTSPQLGESQPLD